ncbi:MAG: Molybdenum ABC transporter permease protein ModB [Rhodanobacteraceae bacterium]|jgi:molybdate transport system permease protein|nr:MAG: Molybdenum ABC transporter permease protein ModB [Rhodanobacteraceae bacterium]
MSLLTHAETVALALSFKVSLFGVFASLPVALGCAWLLARTRFFGKPVFEGLLLLPLILPPVVTGYILLMVFGHHGPVGRLLDAAGLSIAFRWTGAALAAAVMAFPLLVVALRNAFESVDRKLEHAAATLGAGPWRIFFGITLPLSLRGLAAGLALAFARAFGEFGATITFVSSIPGQTRTLPIALYELISTPGGEGGALRLTLVAVIVALLASLVAALMLLRGGTRQSEAEA